MLDKTVFELDSTVMRMVMTSHGVTNFMMRSGSRDGGLALFEFDSNSTVELWNSGDSHGCPRPPDDGAGSLCLRSSVARCTDNPRGRRWRRRRKIIVVLPIWVRWNRWMGPGGVLWWFTYMATTGPWMYGRTTMATMTFLRRISARLGTASGSPRMRTCHRGRRRKMRMWRL